MPQNLEIKVRISDIQSAEEIARSLPAIFTEHLNQVDTYFHVRQGRLKLREINGTQSELIYYNRDEQSNKRISDFTIYPCRDAVMLKKLLASALGIENIVEKHRALYMYQSTRIHLDHVKLLGYFLELETPINEPNDNSQDVVDFLVRSFGIKISDYITCSYLDLMPVSEQSVLAV